jgi:hypothetical protein
MPKRAPDSTEARIDALHVTPPREFVAKRNALARELGAIRDPRAAEVKTLPRPTLPVWSINLTAREDPAVVQSLLASGEQVVRAHRLVLGGASGEALLQANRALGAALEQAVARATRFAKEGGHPLSISLVSRVRATLRSMALGERPARDLLESGRVLAESARTGLEGLEGLSPIRARPQAAPRKTPHADRAARERATVAARESARESARERARLAAARRNALTAEKDLGKADAAVARLRGEAEEAQRRADEARNRLHDAEARVVEARRRLEEARRLSADRVDP